MLSNRVQCIRARARPIDKLAVFSNDFVREKIIELSTVLSFFLNGVDLIISVPPIRDKIISGFLFMLWRFY
jgi:hypothetical protein